MINEIKKDNFSEFTNSEKLSIVKVSANWCGPCRMVDPIFEKVSQNELYSDVTFGKVDSDVSIELSKELEIRSIPSMIFFKNGQEVKRFVGVFNEEQLNTMIDETKKLKV